MERIKMSTNIFPLPFSTHLIFVAVAFVFFLIQFIRTKYKYEIIMAAAVAVTMLIYAKDTKMWFYSIGILEFGLIILALVFSIVEKRSRKELAEETGVETKADTEGEE